MFGILYGLLKPNNTTFMFVSSMNCYDDISGYGHNHLEIQNNNYDPSHNFVTLQMHNDVSR